MNNSRMFAERILLRAEEVAEILNVSKPMVYRLIRTGEIPVVRIGSLVRVRASTLNEYIESLEFAKSNRLV